MEGWERREVNYWLVVTSAANFKQDRAVLKFLVQGLPLRFVKSLKRMEVGDRIVYYIMGLQKFGATATISGEYFEDYSKLWTDSDEMWPARRPSQPDLVLEDDELVDAKKLVPELSFISNKDYWGASFQGSLRQIPEEDFRLVESEMRKAVVGRPDETLTLETPHHRSESEYEEAILGLPLTTDSLHDRLGEMLEQIGRGWTITPRRGTRLPRTTAISWTLPGSPGRTRRLRSRCRFLGT